MAAVQSAHIELLWRCAECLLLRAISGLLVTRTHRAALAQQGGLPLGSRPTPAPAPVHRGGYCALLRSGRSRGACFLAKRKGRAQLAGRRRPVFRQQKRVGTSKIKRVHLSFASNKHTSLTATVRRMSAAPSAAPRRPARSQRQCPAYVPHRSHSHSHPFST